MVTMPSAAADDPGIIASFLKAGMGLMRINCAHDSADSWHKMIDNLRLAQQSINKPCKVYMDLAGPKLRIGTMPSLGRFKRIKTRKNAHGQVVQNAEVEFYLQSKCVNNRPELVPVVALFDGGVKEGDIAVVQDGKGKARRLLVTQVFANKIIARCKKSVFFETDQIIELYRGGQLISRDQVALLPEVRDSITLYKGDLIDLLPPGHHEPIESGISSVNCTMKEVFYSAKVGQSICFDDGKIQGIIVKASHKQLRVEITHAKLSGSRLQGDKGINLPQTYLSTSAMTEKDQNDLIEMVQRVDLIGMSFVRKPSDIKSLKRMLETLRAMDKGVILKIENKMAFDNLAALLLTGLKLPKFGVMLARGDLAAEVGFERLAEVQEEILWLCEAAHVPVIWATQVLENLAKKHAPSRAEISDTVMASRAECVMLNKGENMVNTIEVLGDILSRMDTHQRKRKSKLRPLNVCFSPEDYDAPLPVDSIDKTNLEVDI
nr:pyruvate kinase [Photobacterium sp. BZF1]